MEEGYFLILPSNTPSISPGNRNTTSKFTIPLPKPIEHNNEWEVALLEINYPHSWSDGLSPKSCMYKIGKQEIRQQMQFAVPLEWYPCGQSKDNQSVITHYGGIEDIIKALNGKRPEIFQGSFDVSAETGRVRIYMDFEEVIEMDQNLSSVLGFDESTYRAVHGKIENKKSYHRELRVIEAENKPDVKITMYNMFVYCNLVSETYVGNKMVNLLRTVPVKQERAGQYVTEHFHPLRYLPLSSSYFHNIDILITDDIGEQVKFEWGKVIIHLHMRKRITENKK